MSSGRRITANEFAPNRKPLMKPSRVKTPLKADQASAKFRKRFFTSPVRWSVSQSSFSLHALVILRPAVLRVDIAVIELLNEAFHIVSPSLF